MLELLGLLAPIVLLLLQTLLKAQTPEEKAQARVNEGDQAVADLEKRKLSDVRNYIKVRTTTHHS